MLFRVVMYKFHSLFCKYEMRLRRSFRLTTITFDLSLLHSKAINVIFTINKYFQFYYIELNINYRHVFSLVRLSGIYGEIFFLYLIKSNSEPFNNKTSKFLQGLSPLNKLFYITTTMQQQNTIKSIRSRISSRLNLYKNLFAVTEHVPIFYLQQHHIHLYSITLTFNYN